jgi:single-stranded DNA-binding protein
MNIWGEPAKNFAMLRSRGQEILVEASLRQEKQEESVLKGSRLLVVLPTLGIPWTAKVLATEALL